LTPSINVTIGKHSFLLWCWMCEWEIEFFYWFSIHSFWIVSTSLSLNVSQSTFTTNSITNESDNIIIISGNHQIEFHCCFFCSHFFLWQQQK
jgi:hypothetical protein